MNKKKALAALGVFTLVFIVVYLMAAFVSLSFDPHKWGETARILVAVFGGVTGCALAAMEYTFPD